MPAIVNLMKTFPRKGNWLRDFWNWRKICISWKICYLPRNFIENFQIKHFWKQISHTEENFSPPCLFFNIQYNLKSPRTAALPKSTVQWVMPGDLQRLRKTDRCPSGRNRAPPPTWMSAVIIRRPASLPRKTIGKINGHFRTPTRPEGPRLMKSFQRFPLNNRAADQRFRECIPSGEVGHEECNCSLAAQMIGLSNSLAFLWFVYSTHENLLHQNALRAHCRKPPVFTRWFVFGMWSK